MNGYLGTKNKAVPHLHLGRIGLVLVAKVGVLAVRHSLPRLLVQVLVLGRAVLGLLLVGPHVVAKQEHRDDGAGRLREQEGQLGGAEVGGVLVLERLGSDNVSDGKGGADEGDGKHALGGAGDIGHHPLDTGLAWFGLPLVKL